MEGAVPRDPPHGRKLWRYRYRIAGKENVFAAGEYAQPRSLNQGDKEARIEGGQLTLEEARIKRSEWRALVKQGIHPSHRRAEAKASNNGQRRHPRASPAGGSRKGKKWTPKDS
jgi:hypothetical protein